MSATIMVRALMALLLFFSACGGSTGGGDNGAAATPAQAQADCEEFFLDFYCPAFIKCLSGFTMDDCTAALADFDCAAVQGENGQLSTCEAQLKGGTCKQIAGDGTMPALPLSCTGVFHR